MSKSQHEFKNNTLCQSKFPYQMEEQIWDTALYPDLNKVLDTASYDIQVHKLEIRLKWN